MKRCSETTYSDLHDFQLAHTVYPGRYGSAVTEVLDANGSAWVQSQSITCGIYLKKIAVRRAFIRIPQYSPVHIIRPVLDTQQSGRGQKM